MTEQLHFTLPGTAGYTVCVFLFVFFFNKKHELVKIGFKSNVSVPILSCPGMDT